MMYVTDLPKSGGAMAAPPAPTGPKPLEGKSLVCIVGFKDDFQVFLSSKPVRIKVGD